MFHVPLQVRRQRIPVGKSSSVPQKHPSGVTERRDSRDELTAQFAQCRRRTRCNQGSFARRDRVGAKLLENRSKNALYAIGEMVVDRRHRHLGLLGD